MTLSEHGPFVCAHSIFADNVHVTNSKKPVDSADPLAFPLATVTSNIGSATRV